MHSSGSTTGTATRLCTVHSLPILTIDIIAHNLYIVLVTVQVHLLLCTTHNVKIGSLL